MNLAQALLNVATKLPVNDPQVERRLNRAYAIVAANGSGYAIQYPLRKGQPYRVTRASTQLLEDNSATYEVTNQSCTCPDFDKCRAGLCKHRLAIILLEEMGNEKD